MPRWLNQIKSFSEFRRFLILTITVTTFVGGAAFGASKWYVKNELKKNLEDVELNETLSALQSGQQDANNAAHANSCKIDSALVLLVDVQKQVKTNTGQVGALKRSYTDYIKADESLTREEFIEYMDELWGEKKNEIVWKPLSDRRDIENTYTIENMKSNLNP